MLNQDFDAVLEVLQRFIRGWEELNEVKILSTIAKQDDTMIWGTDQVERWVGYDAFAEGVRVQVESFSNPVYAWGDGHPVVGVRGSAAWAYGDLNVSLDTDDEPWAATMRSTFVLLRDDSTWRIVHAHFSIGQEDAVLEYEAGT